MTQTATKQRRASGAELSRALDRVTSGKELAQRAATRLREAGWTWREIGEVAGCTGMAAQKRWDPAVQSRSRRY